MEQEKKKLNVKIIIPIVIVVIATIFIIGNIGTSKTHKLGETVTKGNLEITLNRFEYVDNVYEGAYLTASQRVGDYSRTEASSGNVLISVTYTIKNTGKSAKTSKVSFGEIEYNNGYVFSAKEPVGIHLVTSHGAVSISSITETIQPLSEAIKVTAFLEVPEEVKNNEQAPLIYEVLGVSYKIR